MVFGVCSACGRYGGRCAVGVVVGVWSVLVVSVWLVWWSVCGWYGGRYGGQCVIGMEVGV